MASKMPASTAGILTNSLIKLTLGGYYLLWTPFAPATHTGTLNYPSNCGCKRNRLKATPQLGLELWEQPEEGLEAATEKHADRFIYTLAPDPAAPAFPEVVKKKTNTIAKEKEHNPFYRKRSFQRNMGVQGLTFIRKMRYVAQPVEEESFNLKAAGKNSHKMLL